MTLSEGAINSKSTHFLEYFIAVYDIYGNFEEFRLLETDFMLCPSSINDGVYARKFGTDFKNNCDQNFFQYFSDYQMKLYELFIYDKVDKSYKEIPVAITNF